MDNQVEMKFDITDVLHKFLPHTELAMDQGLLSLDEAALLLTEEIIASLEFKPLIKALKTLPTES